MSDNLWGFQIKTDPDMAPDTIAFEDDEGRRQVMHLSEWLIDDE